MNDTNLFNTLLSAAMGSKQGDSTVAILITTQIVTALITFAGMLFTYLKAKHADDNAIATKESTSKIEVVQDKIHEAVNSGKTALETKIIGLNEKVVDLTQKLAVSQEQRITAEKAVLLATVPAALVVPDALMTQIIAAVKANAALQSKSNDRLETTSQ